MVISSGEIGPWKDSKIVVVILFLVGENGCERWVSKELGVCCRVQFALYLMNLDVKKAFVSCIRFVGLKSLLCDFFFEIDRARIRSSFSVPRPFSDFPVSGIAALSLVTCSFCCFSFVAAS